MKAGNADIRTQQISERIQILAESILDNSQYTGQESKRHLCREVSIAIFTELVQALASVERINTDENKRRAQSEESNREPKCLDVRYKYNPLLDSQ